MFLFPLEFVATPPSTSGVDAVFQGASLDEGRPLGDMVILVITPHWRPRASEWVTVYGLLAFACFGY